MYEVIMFDGFNEWKVEYERELDMALNWISVQRICYPTWQGKVWDIQQHTFIEC